jgi:hypothetical protein
MSLALRCTDGEMQLPNGAVQESSLALQLLNDCCLTGHHVLHVPFEVAAVRAWASDADPSAFTLQELLEVAEVRCCSHSDHICRVVPSCAECILLGLARAL